MNSAAQLAAIQELISRGLIGPEPPPRPVTTGNADRRDTCSLWLAHLPNQRPALLRLANRLRHQADRHASFLRDCPDLVSRVWFHVIVPQGEVIAEELLPGRTVADIARESALRPETIQPAIAHLLHRLALTEQMSTETARQAEWKAWAARLVRLSIFPSTASQLLSDCILPPLYAALTADLPATTRWTNGDFHADNLLLDSSGNLRLVDLEHAQRTHFHGEDAVRFHMLSDVARQHPDWFNAIPIPGLAWHLYFWLRQLELECTVNTESYVGRIAPYRLSVIRRLAEQLLSVNLTNWPEPVLPVSFQIEENSHVGTRWTLAGWCFFPSVPELRSIAAMTADGIAAETPLVARPDVQHHFGGRTEARLSGFRLTVPLIVGRQNLHLAALAADGTLLPFATFPTPPSPPPPNPVGHPVASGRLHLIPPAELPLLSVVMPVFNPPAALLARAIESVIAQSYADWELCIVDDASTDRAVTQLLRDFAASDSRIRLQTQSANTGISRATNAGIALAGGSHTAFLDHDDELAPDALAEVAATLHSAPHTDVIYTDQDKCDVTGARFEPFLKPSWSPVYFLGVMYMGHLMVARTSLLREVGGCDPAYDRIQDYELVLRLSERTRDIAHIRKVLYHWRVSPGSIAQSSHAKGPVDSMQVTAVGAHLARRGIAMAPVAHPTLPHRVRLFPAAGSRSTDFPISVISAARSPVAFPGEWTDDPHLARGEYLLFLQGGFAFASPDCLSILQAHLDLPGIGAVSPLVVGPDDRVEYAGEPFLVGENMSADGPGGMLACSREVQAFSPICYMVKRSVFRGFQIKAGDSAALIAALKRCGLASLYVANAILRRQTG